MVLLCTFYITVRTIATLHSSVLNCLSTSGPGQLSRYSDPLRAGRSEDRTPVGTKFSPPVQMGTGAHPASYTMGTGFFPGVKRPGVTLTTYPPSSAGVKEKIQMNQPTRCSNFSDLLLVVQIQLNMFRASSCPLSEAQQLQ